MCQAGQALRLARAASAGSFPRAGWNHLTDAREAFQGIPAVKARRPMDRPRDGERLS